MAAHPSSCHRGEDWVGACSAHATSPRRSQYRGVPSAAVKAVDRLIGRHTCCNATTSASSSKGFCTTESRRNEYRACGERGCTVTATVGICDSSGCLSCVSRNCHPFIVG